MTNGEPVEVAIPLDRAVAGDFPPVCVMTGEAADGSVPVVLDRSFLRWRAKTVRIPMSKKAFRAWYFMHSLMLRARTGAILLIVGALAFSARNALIALALLIAGGAVMALSVWAENRLSLRQPEIHRSKGSITLRGVHHVFARAVTQSG